MKIHFSCSFCGKDYSVDAALAGRKGRCKDCGNTMRIPGGGETSSAAASPAPAAPKPRPASTAPRPASAGSKPKPAPVPAPPPADDVDDPYGLEDASSTSPMTIRPDMLADDGGDAPLPRVGATKPAAGKQTKRKRGVDEGPWGLPIRQAAIGLMGFVLILGRAMRAVHRAHQEQAVGSYIQTGMLVLTLLAAALSLVSVVGAIVSFARGNRSAFRGESTGGQVGWGLTVLASLAVAYLYLGGSLGSLTGGRLGTLDARLSDREVVPMMVYEDMVRGAVGYHKRLAEALEGLGNPDAGPGLHAFFDFAWIEGDARSLDMRGRSTPLPTRDQVRKLFDQFGGPYREAVVRSAAAATAAMARMTAPADSPPGKAMRELVDNATTYRDEYLAAFPEGSTDPTGWYFAVFSKDAGSGAPPIPAGAALVHEPPAPAPTPAPAASAPPSNQPPPSFVPAPAAPNSGALPPEMQQELERFQRESGNP